MSNGRSPRAQPPTTRWSDRLSAATALSSLVFMVLAIGAAGAFTPGYSHLAQYISELGARGAPLEGLVRYAVFLPAGVLVLGFCVSAWVALPRSRAATFGLIGLAIFAAGYLAAAAFPCDPGCRPATPSLAQVIHNAVGLLGYLLAPAFLLSFAVAARAWPQAGHLVVAGYVAGAAALLGFVTMSPTSPMVGLSQRLLEGAVLVWVALCGRYIGARGGNAA